MTAVHASPAPLPAAGSGAAPARPGRPQPGQKRPRPGRKRRTRKGRQTDEAFREAARLVFARDGYLNAKISDIAAAAGRSVASFYNYYDTKADLLIALARGISRRSHPAGGPALPAACPARRRCGRPWRASGAPTPSGAAS